MTVLGWVTLAIDAERARDADLPADDPWWTCLRERAVRLYVDDEARRLLAEVERWRPWWRR